MPYLFIVWRAKHALSQFKMSISEPSSTTKFTKFSVLIPFRNEAAYLPGLLQSIAEMDYPTAAFEVLLVNDHSTDLSNKELTQLCDQFDFRIRLLHLSEVNLSTKKQAVYYGVQNASGDYILTTDGDCILPSGLLKTHHAQILSDRPDLIAGAVTFPKGETWLSKFQYYDFMAVQAISMAYLVKEKPIACNAAHMCFMRSTFMELKPFDDNLHIASGDDIFLLEKFRENKLKIQFLKRSQLVLTASQESLLGLINQRKRWLMKSKYVKNLTAKRVGFFLFIGNFNLILGLVFLFFSVEVDVFFSLYFLLKLIIDYFLLTQFSKKFNLGLCAREILIFYLIYPLSLFIFSFVFFYPSFKWKSRQFKM